MRIHCAEVRVGVGSRPFSALHAWTQALQPAAQRFTSISRPQRTAGFAPAEGVAACAAFATSISRMPGASITPPSAAAHFGAAPFCASLSGLDAWHSKQSIFTAAYWWQLLQKSPGALATLPVCSLAWHSTQR